MHVKKNLLSIGNGEVWETQSASNEWMVLVRKKA